MHSTLRISEAASLGLHSLAVLAARPDKPLSAREIAQELRVSEAHLAKVLQRLGKAGLVQASRGPGGGFVLAQAPHDISLLEIYESIDGPLLTHNCLFKEPVCEGATCLMGDLLRSINKQIYDYLRQTRLADVAKAYRQQATSETAL